MELSGFKNKNKLSAESKRAMAEIKEKLGTYMADRRKANNILDIMVKLEDENSATVIASVKALEKIFVTNIEEGNLSLANDTDHSAEGEEVCAEKRLKCWLGDNYRDTKTRLTHFFQTASEDIKIQCLSTLFNFLKAEGDHPLVKPPTKHYFPESTLDEIIMCFLSDEHEMKSHVIKLQAYFKYNDVKYHSLKSIKKILKEAVTKELNEMYLENCFSLMKMIKLEDGDDDYNNNLCNWADGQTFKFDQLEGKKIFRAMWMTFLKTKLSNNLYKRVLYALDEKVIPFLDKPLLLTDFLIDSYNKGGVCSILALNGIFILMVNYNLEFPDFYKNLYALFQPRVFQTKYRARFFFLSDIFLSSTHLPEYLVAAFVKRLSRMTMTAPTPCLLLLLNFIRNLLIRHKSLTKMINNPKNTTEFDVDPFDVNEVDPAKCKAINSSLWEIKDLQNHYNPVVAMAAKFIDIPIQPQQAETDISDYLEMSYDDMLNLESNELEKAKDFPLNHKNDAFNTVSQLVGPDWLFNKLPILDSDII
ncbi:hypothetical protein CHUAL_005856 [Chamberlinius hualienensis]